jgi:hypothetical protein
MSQAIYTYDELDEILRGDGHGGYVGVSAIDGLVASVGRKFSPESFSSPLKARQSIALFKPF